MAGWTLHHWDPVEGSGLPRSARKSGNYSSYRPDPLSGSSLRLDPEVDATLARAEQAVRELDRRSFTGLVPLARLLLRSEAIASSRIEGIAPSPKQAALAELGLHESVSGVSQAARLVAQNMTVVAQASAAIAAAEHVVVDQLVALQRSLLTDTPRLHGLRRTQNWVGGSAYQPLEAEFVPPAPQDVPSAMEDLVDYMNGAAHSPIVQAALVHAQFETIHPFADGNGRVGRALIHTVLTRRGLTQASILPVSLVLATFDTRYIEGLTAFRHDATPDSETAHRARQTWIAVFAGAVIDAANQASTLVDEVGELHEDWFARIQHHRGESGRRRALRSDSAVRAIIDGLPGTPVLTPTSVRRIHGVSMNAASKALESLHGADILTTVSIGRGLRAYLCPDVLDLVTLTERRLASTRFDTRASSPNRPVPQAP